MTAELRTKNFRANIQEGCIQVLDNGFLPHDMIAVETDQYGRLNITIEQGGEQVIICLRGQGALDAILAALNQVAVAA